MAYGLEIKNSNGNIQWSSEFQDQLTVIDTGSTTSSVAYDGTNEILALNMPSAGNQQFLVGNTNATATSWTNGSGYNVNWLKLKRIRTQTAANKDGNDTNTYGIQVKNSSQEITWTSAFTTFQSVVNVIGSGTVSSFGTTAAQAALIYSGDPTNVYVAPGRMTTTGGNPAYYFDNLYFDYTNDEIKLRSTWGADIGNGYIYTPQANQSTILIFKRV